MEKIDERNKNFRNWVILFIFVFKVLVWEWGGIVIDNI